MADYYTKQENEVSSYRWVYKLLLYVSFVWVSVYPVATSLSSSYFYYGYGNLFDVSSEYFISNLFTVLIYALIEWIVFELVFYFYRYFLSFKIYTFVVPLSKFRIECRVFYTYRNLIYGIFVNLCFLYPFLSSYLLFFSIVSSILLLIFFAYYISKKYSEPIISHFVFKNFALPLFVFEGIIILFHLWGWL